MKTLHENQRNKWSKRVKDRGKKVEIKYRALFVDGVLCRSLCLDNYRHRARQHNEWEIEVKKIRGR